MGTTSIEWARNVDGTRGETWNPFRGCQKISPGCKHCYAETFAERWRGIPGHPYEHGFDPRFVPEAIDIPLRRKKPTTFFVNSMSDLFFEGFTNEQIAAVFGVMAACPQHTFQVLTKRAERLPEWFGWLGARGGLGPYIRSVRVDGDRALPRLFDSVVRTQTVRWRRIRSTDDPWCSVFNAASFVDAGPLPNVWLGVSVESQKYADERISKLLSIPNALPWLSIEPMLGPVDIRRWLIGEPRVRFVVCGAESGHGARPMAEDWARQLRDQCSAAGVPYFLKQFATPTGKKISLPLLDGRQWAEMPEARS